jgi:hypothetical protein
MASVPVGAPRIAPRPQSRPSYLSARTTRCTDTSFPTTTPPFLAHVRSWLCRSRRRFLPDSLRFALTSLAHPPLPSPPPGKPIDPGVFRSVTTLRRLIDEASELAMRALSGMSAAALGSIHGGSPNAHSSPWALAQSLGINPLGDPGGGRNIAMSAMRIHRLRALAVQKLAAAYRAR